MNPSKRDELRIPMTFIGFAIAEGHLFNFTYDKFIVQGRNEHGNSVVYGAIYLLHDEYYHIRTLDALHNCSLSALGVNHKLDMNHRIASSVIPISFNTLDELDRLKYQEHKSVPVYMYVANSKHPKIHQRINIKRGNRYRILSGIDKESFLSQYREVSK